MRRSSTTSGGPETVSKAPFSITLRPSMWSSSLVVEWPGGVEQHREGAEEAPCDLMAPFSEIASWMLVCQGNTDGIFLQVSSKHIPQSDKKLRVEIHLDSPCFSRWMYTARDA